MRAALFSYVLVAAALQTAPSEIFAQPNSTATTVHWENDVMGGTDDHYTNGLKVTRERQALEIPKRLERVVDALLDCSTEDPPCSFQRGWTLGQNIYTPRDIDVPDAIPGDRPYAGWLYGGAHAAMRNRREMHRIGVDIGVLGPAAGAEVVQTEWHRLLRLDLPQGWDHQMDNELGIVLTHDYKRKLAVRGFEARSPVCPGFCWDLIGRTGVSAGTIFNLAEVGVRLRVGKRIEDDFGLEPIGPVVLDQPFGKQRASGIGWYFFGGSTARINFRNSLIEGSLFHDGPALEANRYVSDLEVGAAFRWRRFRFMYRQIVRSPEIDGESNPHRYGSLAFSIVPFD
jgi:lipid A 3-O-deacylase